MQKKMKAKDTAVYLLVAALIGCSLILRYYDPTFLQILRLKDFDIHQQWLPRTISEDNVTIVAIDDKSLNEVGQWPWPRTVLAELVQIIAEEGARVIGFSMVFAEPDRWSSGAAPATEETLSSDHVFVKAVRGSRVVLSEWPTASARPAKSLEDVARTPVVITGSDSPSEIYKFFGLVRNLAPLEDAASGIGVQVLEMDRGHVVRRLPLVVGIQDQILPTFVPEIARIATGSEKILARTAMNTGIETVDVGDYEIPTDPSGRAWIHFSESGLGPLRFCRGHI